MNIKRNVLLNPGPSTTTDSVKLAQVVPDICPRESEFADLMHGFREDLVKIVHGDPEKYTAVLFCGSGTLNIDVCLNSLLPDGKKVLIVNNGAYSARAVEICVYYGLPHIDLQFKYDEIPDLDMIKTVLDNNPDVSVVYATHNETGTGILNPIRDIGAIAHEHDAVFIVDTTSTYAMRPIDAEKDNIDFCMASAQKGLSAFAGLSFVIGKKSIIEASANYPKRSYYCNLFMQYDYFERTGEMHFTPPVQTIYAAIEALKEYWSEGETAKWNRHMSAFNAIHRELDELGFKDAIKREWQAGLVVAVKYPDDPNWDFKKIHDYCYKRGYTIYPGKIDSASTFRLCALGAINVNDIQHFFKVFRSGLIHYGVSIPVTYDH